MGRFGSFFNQYKYKYQTLSVARPVPKPRPIADGRTTPYASREKALLDLLYLYPFYNTESELLELRLDRDILREELDWQTWLSMGRRFQCARLEKRMRLLEKVYNV